MANDISSGVWRIDTLPFSYAFRVKIISADWSDATTIGHRLIATQANGKPLFDTMANQVNYLQGLGRKDWVNGITVTTLDSGVLTINVGAGK